MIRQFEAAFVNRLKTAILFGSLARGKPQRLKIMIFFL